jgi:hypothetical protein
MKITLNHRFARPAHLAIEAALLVVILGGCTGNGVATQQPAAPVDSPIAVLRTPTPSTASTSTVPHTPTSVLTPGPMQVPQMTEYNEVENWSSSREPGILWVRPNGIVIDHEDNIYTTEFQGNQVRKLTPDGELLLEWGKTGDSNGEFNAPRG